MNWRGVRQRHNLPQTTITPFTHLIRPQPPHKLLILPTRARHDLRRALRLGDLDREGADRRGAAVDEDGLPGLEVASGVDGEGVGAEEALGG